MEDYFVIGDVVNTQGIKGEVRVIPCTDDESRFELLDSVFLEQRGKMYVIISSSYFLNLKV